MPDVVLSAVCAYVTVMLPITSCVIMLPLQLWARTCHVTSVYLVIVLDEVVSLLPVRGDHSAQVSDGDVIVLNQHRLQADGDIVIPK